MSVRDQKFYGNILFWMFILAVCLRYLVMFSGIRISVPYFDPLMETLFTIISAIIRSFASFLGGWSN